MYCVLPRAATVASVGLFSKHLICLFCVPSGDPRAIEKIKSLEQWVGLGSDGSFSGLGATRKSPEPASSRGPTSYHFEWLVSPKDCLGWINAAK